MKLGERYNHLVRYCADISEFYPVSCEVHVIQGEREQDSDWVQVTVHDLTSENGDTSTATSPPSPAVHCCEAWIDDLMLDWFKGGKGEDS